MVLKGKIIKILDNKRVIINLGYREGVKKDMKFVIYDEGEEIIDPETKKSLGKREIPKHHVKVSHIQENFAILDSDEWTRGGILSSIFLPENYSYQKNFSLKENISPSNKENKIISVGDLVREMPD